MGLFDTIIVKCPKCGDEQQCQTKSGPCDLGQFTLADAPDDVLANVNRHAPFYCDCGAVFMVNVSTRAAVLDYEEEG